MDWKGEAVVKMQAEGMTDSEAARCAGITRQGGNDRRCKFPSFAALVEETMAAGNHDPPGGRSLPGF